MLKSSSVFHGIVSRYRKLPSSSNNAHLWLYDGLFSSYNTQISSPTTTFGSSLRDVSPLNSMPSTTNDHRTPMQNLLVPGARMMPTNETVANTGIPSVNSARFWRSTRIARNREARIPYSIKIPYGNPRIGRVVSNCIHTQHKPIATPHTTSDTSDHIMKRDVLNLACLGASDGAIAPSLSTPERVAYETWEFIASC